MNKMNKHSINKCYTKFELVTFNDDELLDIINVEMSLYERRFPNIDLVLDAISLCKRNKDIMKINKKFKKEFKNSFLLLASQYGHYEAVVKLLKMGEDIEFADNLGYRALIIACDFGYMDIVHHLLEWGANPNVANESYEFPLDLAIQNGPELIELLLQYGATRMDERYEVIIEDVKSILDK
jgi:hypothetical protein